MNRPYKNRDLESLYGFFFSQLNQLLFAEAQQIHEDLFRVFPQFGRGLLELDRGAGEFDGAVDYPHGACFAVHYLGDHLPGHRMRISHQLRDRVYGAAGDIRLFHFGDPFPGGARPGNPYNAFLQGFMVFRP